jgi:hypothetical protein
VLLISLQASFPSRTSCLLPLTEDFTKSQVCSPLLCFPPVSAGAVWSVQVTNYCWTVGSSSTVAKSPLKQRSWSLFSYSSYSTHIQSTYSQRGGGCTDRLQKAADSRVPHQKGDLHVFRERPAIAPQNLWYKLQPGFQALTLPGTGVDIT